ncbi:unnamed protein product [Absidia cylindrospora]
MPHLLPLEILCHVFSFLQYQDLYLIRGVSRQWCALAEEHIYLDVKVQQQPVTITIGQAPFASTMNMYADSYDPIEKVVEFKPEDGHSLHNNNATTPPCSSWQLYHHCQMQIKFGQHQSQPHCNSTTASWLQSLTPQEQQQVLFHLQYNPVMECLYALPAYSWLSSSMTEQEDQHYVGDKSLILSFSYVPPPPPQSPSPPPTTTTTKPTYTHSTSLLSLPLSSPPLGAPQIKIHWLRVTLDWIISFAQPKIQCTQIYGDRYSQLYHSLAHQYGCYRYDELSEPVLAYIIQQDKDHSPSAMVSASKKQQSTRMASVTDSILTTTTVPDNRYKKEDDDTLPQQLLSYIQEHTHEYHTRLSKLQHMLEGACVDPRMIWKYPFAKSFVVGNGSLLSEEDVVRRIQDSEEEWRALTRVLKRRFCT